MNKNDSQISDIVESYMGLRRLAGFAGIALPILLIIGTLIMGSPLLPSISDYYHTQFSSLFVGTLFAISVFLWFYDGDQSYENLITKTASILLLCVACCPTPAMSEYTILEGHVYFASDFKGLVIPTIAKPEYFRWIHLCSAGIFFGLLSVLVLRNFIRSEKENRKSRTRINLYRMCGYGMIASIVSIGAIPVFVDGQETWMFPLVLTCETFALVFFGVSWLVKGRIEEIAISKTPV